MNKKKSILKNTYGAILFLVSILFFYKEMLERNEVVENRIQSLEERDYDRTLAKQIKEMSEAYKKRENDFKEIQEAIRMAKEKEQNQRIEDYLSLLATLEKTQEEYQIMRENLLKVKEYLNISPEEENLYSDVVSIGDAGILVDPCISIYASKKDVTENKNPKTSYYGTKEIRYVEAITMVYKETVTDVDNMEDYELFKSIGFQVTGYKLVNQYSLKGENTIEKEGYVKPNEFCLIFKPKKQGKRLPC